MNNKIERNNIFSQVISSIIKFNPEALLEILDSTLTYEDLPLIDFVILVGDRLQSFKDKGDTELKMSFDLCAGCNCKSPVVVFTGKETGATYALFFKYDKDRIIDIYECTSHGNIASDYPF